MQTYLIFNNPLSLDSNSALIIEQQYQSDINKHSVHLKLTTTGRQSAYMNLAAASHRGHWAPNFIYLFHICYLLHSHISSSLT